MKPKRSLMFQLLIFLFVALTFTLACGDPPPPDPPKGLSTNPDDNIDGIILLKWDVHEDEDVVGYKVYRSTEADGKFKEVADIPEKHDEKTTPSFTDKNVIVGNNYEKKYYYRITAYKKDLPDNKINESKPTETIQANSQNYSRPAPPDRSSFIVKASNLETPSFELIWKIGKEIDLAGYYVYRRDEDKPIPVDQEDYRVTKELIHVKAGSNELTWTDTDVTPGKTYYYTIAAVDKGGLISQNPPSLRKGDILLERPKPDSPQDGETVSDKPTFKWSNVDGAVGYIVAIKKSLTFGGELWRSDFVKDTSLTYDGAQLSSGQKYYWYVYAFSSRPDNPRKDLGNSSSSARSFIVK